MVDASGNFSVVEVLAFSGPPGRAGAGAGALRSRPISRLQHLRGRQKATARVDIRECATAIRGREGRDIRVPRVNLLSEDDPTPTPKSTYERHDNDNDLCQHDPMSASKREQRGAR